MNGTEPDLDPEQRAAVETSAPRVLVLAGAGSGKTRTLVHRVGRLVSTGAPASSILVATFTQRAARELKHRTRSLLGSAAAGLRVGTFHALALADLRRHGSRLGLDPGFRVLGRDERRSLLEEALVGAGLDPRGRPGVAVERLERALGRAENDERPLAETLAAVEPSFTAHAEALEHALDLYAAAKARHGGLDFDDLLVLWRHLLSHALQPQRGLRHVLVDEFQDTTPIQARLAESLAAYAHLFVVGDDAQAIYGFRGARFDHILEFPLRGPTEVHRLQTSYRSPPAVIALATASLELNPMQFPKPLRSAKAAGPPIRLLVGEDEDDEAALVVRELLALNRSGVPWSDQAILLRRHRDARPFELALTAASAPYTLRAGRRFLDRPHVAVIAAHLALLARPEDSFAWRRVLGLVPGVGPATASRLLPTLERDGLASAAERVTDALVHASPRARQGLAELRARLARLEAAPPGDALAALLDDEPLAFNLAAAGEPEAVMRDLSDLRAVADAPHPAAALDALALSGEDDHSAGVQVGTVHSAKGLEWPVVCVVGLVDGRFPSQPALAEREGEAEERRLFYVAVTRAEERLFLSRPASARGAPLPPSRFLEELSGHWVGH